MRDNTEQEDKTSMLPDVGDLPALKGMEIFKFGQLEKENLEKISGDEFPQNRITDFTDSKNRPITIKEWDTGKFTWIRAYDTSQTQVPETPNLGQAGMANLALETDQSGEKKMRLGDIMIPDVYRGSGIAKKMLDQSISVAKEKNARQIYGVIEDDKARDFWEHMQEHGWKIDPEKGAYGYVFFDIPDGGAPEKKSLPAVAQRGDPIEAASPLSRADKSEHETQTVRDNFPVQQISENHPDSPLLTDKMKKVLVGISILATLTSSGMAVENYKENHPASSEPTNEIVIEQPQRDSAFGKLIENKDVQYHLAETPAAEVTPTTIAEKIATPAAEVIDQKAVSEALSVNEKPENATSWYEVPEYKQPDAISCTPTSVSMVMGYWNKIDSKYPSRSAKELYKENVVEGKFTSTGMVITDLDDEIQALNYESKTVVDGTRVDLEEELAKGPVIALVKYSGKELAPRGVNHAVVVSGMTEDNHVRVTDPMLGKSRLYTWDQFDAAWGANWGTGATRYFTSILPSDKANK